MTIEINSLQNPRVKEAIRLLDARGRAKTGRFRIDGVRELGMALAAGLQLDEVFLCEELCQETACRQILQQLPQHGTAVLRVSRGVFDKLAYGHRREGIVAVATAPRTRLAELDIPRDAMVALLVGVEKPGNVGAVLRSADAAGAAALLVVDAGTDLYNPNAIRASQGAIFTVPTVAAQAAEARDWLRSGGFRCYAARPQAQRDFTACDYRPATAFILGSEAQGLGNSWHDDAITPIRVPMRGRVDSLNVATTAALLFYEALRQRGAT